MKKIIEAFGEVFFEGLVIGLLFVNVIYGLKDNQGKQDVFHIIGEGVPKENIEYAEYVDFKSIYKEECRKEMPTIQFLGNHLTLGINKLSDFFAAYDYEGRELEIVVNRILDQSGMELTDRYDSVSDEIFLEETGSYLFEMEIRDADNRIKRYKIQVPVCV